MAERPYSNREHDSKHQEIMGAINRVDARIADVVKQTTYTNGKVRKLIMAVIALGGMSLGLGIQELQPLISLLL